LPHRDRQRAAAVTILTLLSGIYGFFVPFYEYDNLNLQFTIYFKVFDVAARC
jgi:hypothetical protein